MTGPPREPPRAVAGLKRGALVGGFRIKRLLGSGSLGAVYEAEQASVGRSVALRLIGEDRFHDGDFAERFDRHQRLHAALSHPNLVPTYEAGDWNGGRFVAMRMIGGRSLEELLDDRAPVPRRALDPVAEALRAAHAAGLVHGNVTAHNVLIAADGTPFLSDLGLGREGSPEADLTALDELAGRLPARVEARARPWNRLTLVAGGALVAGAVALALASGGDESSPPEREPPRATPPVAPRDQITGTAAARAEPGERLDEVLIPLEGVRPARVLLVELPGTIALDLREGGRIARLELPPLDAAGELQEFDSDCGGPAAFCMRWHNPGGEELSYRFGVSADGRFETRAG